jgi:hypothetical protein
VLLPVLLLVFAIVPAVLFAYGTEPSWAAHGPRGLELILWAHRFQWPLVMLSVVLCIGLGVAVIAKKSSVVWLLGLLPVLFLFAHKYTDGPAKGLYCQQDPALVSAADVPVGDANELVVGVVLDSQPYAFFYSALHRTPVVVASVRDRRMALFWSEYANRAQVFTTARDFRADDLEVVCSPDNALLVYNTRLGQFINGVTGLTLSGQIPTGLLEPIPVIKTTWQAWDAAHPDTRVMQGSDAGFTQPLQPRFAMPGTDPAISDTRHICVVAATQPIAVPSEAIGTRPLNLTSGLTSLLLVRVNGVVRAFNRELPGDLVPRFAPGSDAKHKNVAWVDSDTNAGWSSAGAEVDGPQEMHGLVMSPIPVEEDLYWNVMKFWYPQLHLASDAEIAAATVVKSPKPVVVKTPARRRRSVPRGN